MDEQDTYMYGLLAETEAPTDTYSEMSAITISKERYEQLIEAESWAAALEQAGVDNWEGYDLAQEIYDTFN